MRVCWVASLLLGCPLACDDEGSGAAEAGADQGGDVSDASADATPDATPDVTPEVTDETPIEDGDAAQEPDDGRDEFGVLPTGWANAVVDSDVPESVEDPDGEPVENVAADPEAAVGPPEQSDVGTVAVGLRGNYFVLDMGEGEAACDEEGDDLVVLEMGFPRGIPEAYGVGVSNTPEGPFIDIGDGRGEAYFDVAAAGLDAARYVRVESLVDDVFTGLGSPSYPGPEIDAVGTYHPCAD